MRLAVKTVNNRFLYVFVFKQEIAYLFEIVIYEQVILICQNLRYLLFLK